MPPQVGEDAKCGGALVLEGGACRLEGATKKYASTE